MAAVQRKLVHKQFNSPLGLYSDQNVKETLDRELRAFSNGTVGIDSNDIRKQLNLAESAVLKMVEEEEYEKAHPGYKRVAWPPADAISVPSVPQLQPQPTYQNQYQPQTTQAFQPVSPKVQESYQQPIYQQPQLQSQEQPQYHSQAQAQHYPYGRGQSAGVIHLRQQAPISQRPAPVFTSQPAAASFRGGSNMRGDMKWPPAEYKAQAAAENEERRKLALGPIFRPRRVNKDYSQFFAKNALNQYYPGYKVPPGTQHVYAEY